MRVRKRKAKITRDGEKESCGWDVWRSGFFGGSLAFKGARI
jgi:hypothetical protein